MLWTKCWMWHHQVHYVYVNIHREERWPEGPTPGENYCQLIATERQKVSFLYLCSSLGSLTTLQWKGSHLRIFRQKTYWFCLVIEGMRGDKYDQNIMWSLGECSVPWFLFFFFFFSLWSGESVIAPSKILLFFFCLFILFVFCPITNLSVLFHRAHTHTYVHIHY